MLKLFFAIIVLILTSLSVAAQSTHPSVVADLQVVRSSNNKPVPLGRVYRDEAGRVNLTLPDRITLTDPATCMLYILDPTSYKYNAKQNPWQTSGNFPPDERLSARFDAATELGRDTIGEYVTLVKQYSNIGEMLEKQLTLTVWYSTELDLVLQVQLTDSDGESTIISCANIITNIALDPALFVVPSYYRHDPLTFRSDDAVECTLSCRECNNFCLLTMLYSSCRRDKN